MLVTILALRSPNSLRKVGALKKSLKILLVPVLASVTKFSAGSKPTSSSPSTGYERRRVPSLQPISRTISPTRGLVTLHALAVRLDKASRIVELIPDLYQ